jgi:predicted aspartyl protease
MTTITFPHSITYTGNRPYADVLLINGPSRSTTYKCLVDTGADYLQLPASAGGSIGLSFGSAAVTTITTAAGSVNMHLVSGVTVEIERKRVSVDVLFDPANATMPIAGRQLLIKAFDVAFNSSEWLRT